MPNYEYRCTSCENQFELWQEVGADAPPCPQCQAEVRKVFHPIRTIYKGSGFYVTDLRAEKEKASTPAKSEDKSKSESTSEGAAPATTSPASEAKSESKPESAKTPTTPAPASANP